MTQDDLATSPTEARNPRTAELDAMPTPELLAVMNDEDQRVAGAVRQALPAIARAVDTAAACLRDGGRLVYCGAGTSGRLGVLDAAECKPTFSAREGQVLALLAGGPEAMWRAVEGAEDDPDRGAADLRAHAIGSGDCVVGISASGRTPYVLGALQQARAAGAATIAVVCVPDSAVAAAAGIPIEVVVGPEVLSGSTRLKAGTATKLVLNMLSTAVFVRLHKVYGNLMVDLQAGNDKLRRRSVRIVAAATGCAADEAAHALAHCGGEAKTAIVALRRGLDAAAARRLLEAHLGSVRAALAAP